MSSCSADAAPPAHTRHYGPLQARDADLEVLLTDGLGGFALSSLAGVPTRCYSGLVVSHLPPVQRFTHLVSPLELLESGDQRHTLHALELAPGVFEGRGLEVLSGVTLRDLLPERVQSVGGVRISRRTVSPAEAGAVVYLYTVDSGEPVTLTLGGYFVDRDMHHVHTEAPSLNVEVKPSQVTVRGERATRVRLHVPGGQHAPEVQLTALTPRPFPQRVYYRHDAARGEPDHDYALGAALWKVHFPAGGGQVALVVQGLTDTTPDIPDPWLAHAQEATRRRELAHLAQNTSGVADGLVATLAVAADAYLVRRQSPAGTSVIAGYPWFADWGRDAMISLTGLTLLTGRLAEARDLLHTFLTTLRRGLIPNHFHENGQGAGYNTVDGALWLAVALERYVAASNDLEFARAALPRLRELLAWHVRGTDHGVHADPADGLLLAGEAGVQLTWMDVKIEDWVVTPRHGKPVEIQGLWLAALGAETRLSGVLGEPGAFSGSLAQARASFGQLWAGQQFADVLGPDGTLDPSVRPNVALALALPDTPATPAQVEATVRQTGAELLTPLGLHTLSPRDRRYRGNYGGPQVLRDAAYHQGTVWPWPLTAHLELLLLRGEVAQARAALGGLCGHVWEAGVGHVSEVFSGDALLPGGCPFQAWSVAELLRGHVLVSQAEGAHASAQKSG